eukprot:gi/632982780/ref/XP_007908324.1/ PREDICTED: complement C1s subcomponent-like isoform X2 [Callorhinchus milii]
MFILWLLLTAWESRCIQLTDISGEISSPNYPLEYPGNSTGIWEISARPGYILKLYLIHVEIKWSERCEREYIKVVTEVKELFNVCGRTSHGVSPEFREYFSSTNSMQVLFQSETSNEDRLTGFLALYSRVDINECDIVAHNCSHFYGNKIGSFHCYCSLGFVIHSSGHTCEEIGTYCPGYLAPLNILEPHWDKFYFQDTVKVSCVKGYEIVEGLKTLPYFFAECNKNGTWNTFGYSCQPVDCALPPGIENGVFSYSKGQNLTTYGSSIQYQCNEPYYKMVTYKSENFSCTAEGSWENRHLGAHVPVCIPVCGLPGNPLVFRSRVLHGSRAEPGNFPWQVHFRIPRGAGALISDRWVLTAAHVVSPRRGIVLSAGLVNLKNRKQAVALIPDRVFVHPLYNNSEETDTYNYDHDIALIRLKAKLVLGPAIAPVCLPRRDSEHQVTPGILGTVSGWGVTENGTLTPHLMYTRLPVSDLEECRSNMEGNGQRVTENMICAGLGVGGDSCQGDSGGAFVFTRPQSKQYYVGGIVSWGINCGSFGFYTKVLKYLEWIEDTMKNNSD